MLAVWFWSHCKHHRLPYCHLYTQGVLCHNDVIKISNTSLRLPSRLSPLSSFPPEAPPTSPDRSRDSWVWSCDSGPSKSGLLSKYCISFAPTLPVVERDQSHSHSTGNGTVTIPKILSDLQYGIWAEITALIQSTALYTKIITSSLHCAWAYWSLGTILSGRRGRGSPSNTLTMAAIDSEMDFRLYPPY